jgi:elongator complex protein 1
MSGFMVPDLKLKAAA